MYAVAYKGVCYQCSYQGRPDSETSTCPVCRFPLIMEPETTPPGGFVLSDILDRPTVRDGGAPPLPGVDPGKRKAQLMAEARKERMRAISERQHIASSVVEHTSLVRIRPEPHPAPHAVRYPDDVQYAIPVNRRWVALKYGILCVSAIAAGILAAALQSS
jgi:hypothetical protein